MKIHQTNIDDDDLPVSITRGRDTCIENDRVICDYNFLDYRFNGQLSTVWARVYTDEMHLISIRSPSDAAFIDDEIMAYLQRRFEKIDILKEEQGYKRLWARKDLKSLLPRTKQEKRYATKRHGN